MATSIGWHPGSAQSPASGLTLSSEDRQFRIYRRGYPSLADNCAAVPRTGRSPGPPERREPA